MRRTVLVSLLIIGAALGVVFGGGSFAVFTDEEDITGGANATSATAGILDFELCGDPVCTTGAGQTTAPSGTPGVPVNSTGVNEAFGDEDLDLVFDLTPCGYNFFAPTATSTCDIPVLIYRALPVAQQLAADLTFENFSAGINAVTPVSKVITTAGGIIYLDCNGDEDTVPVTADGWKVEVTAMEDAMLTDSPDDADYFPAGADDAASFKVIVTLDENALNTCQGTQLKITLRVKATQDNTPHNTDDDDGGT